MTQVASATGRRHFQVNLGFGFSIFLSEPQGGEREFTIGSQDSVPVVWAYEGIYMSGWILLIESDFTR